MANRLPPMLPTDFDPERQREHIHDFSGGILPVFPVTGTPYNGACSCAIGNLAMEKWRIPRYDSLPGTSPEDTKHDLIMARFAKTS